MAVAIKLVFVIVATEFVCENFIMKIFIMRFSLAIKRKTAVPQQTDSVFTLGLRNRNHIVLNKIIIICFLQYFVILQNGETSLLKGKNILRKLRERTILIPAVNLAFN